MPSWPRNILVDAGPLVALFLADDRHHRDALEFARKNTANLLTTWPVLTEAAHFLNDKGKLALYEFVSGGGLALEHLAPQDLIRIAAILKKYPGTDLADGSLIVVAERTGINDVATVDRTDFSVFRTRAGRAFTNHF